MNDEALEKELRKEIRLSGNRWSGDYKSLNDDRRRDLLEILKARRLQQTEAAETFKKKQLAESMGCIDQKIPKLDKKPSTGGGRRVIRGTNSFG